MDHHYSDGDQRLTGSLARPAQETGPRPGVLVFHEAPGLTDHPKRRAAMLADLGYVALAADLYGDGRTFLGPEAMQAMNGLRSDIPLLRRRIAAAFDELARLPGVDPKRLGAIGYCFGGMAALELARTGADLRAVVSFHGFLGAAQPNSPNRIGAAVLACTGSEDPMVPRDQVTAFEEEMRSSGADWQVVTFGGAKHAFTNRDAGRAGHPALEWNPAADRRAWAFAAAFLADAFGEMEADR